MFYDQKVNQKLQRTMIFQDGSATVVIQGLYSMALMQDGLAMGMMCQWPSAVAALLLTSPSIANLYLYAEICNFRLEYI